VEDGALAGGKKIAAREGRAVIFVDETALYLLPGVVRSYAPRGRTPVLRVPLSREHLSIIGGITPDGQLFQQALPHAVRGPDVVRFVRHLVRHLGRVLVIWDGLPAHRSTVVKEYLRNEAHGRVRLERLPAYAPDLNPKEGIWRHLKLVDLANVCCQAVGDLKRVYRRAKERLRHKVGVISGCFGLAGLPI